MCSVRIVSIEHSVQYFGNKMALLKDRKILHKYCMCSGRREVSENFKSSKFYGTVE